MKKTLKTKLMAGTFAAVMGISMLAPVSGMAADLASFNAITGKPVKVEKLADGSELRYYNYDRHIGLEGYRIIKVQSDSKVIEKGFSQSVWDFILKCNMG